MRTLASTSQEDTLNASKYEVWLRVEIENSTGAMKNLSDLGGTNWVHGVSWSWNIDQPVPELRVQLRRDMTDGQSLSPLNENSSLNVTDASTAYAALVDAGRAIDLYTATVDPGAGAPTSSDYDWMFKGEVDEVTFGTAPMTLVARSQTMSHLTDRWVESKTVYGSTGGTLLHTLIQEILTDWTDGVTLWTPSVPTFVVTQYEQQQMPVWQAIQTLAQLIGWDIREVWDAASTQWRLKFFEPSRSPSTGDVGWTFGADKYYDVKRLDIARDDIRNVVSVRYTDASSDPRRRTETVQSTSSVDRWGRRWMEMEEAGDSPISSSSEASAFATAALNDLQDPQADHEIELPYFWPVELQDYMEFTQNGQHYTTDQLFGVYGVAHEVSQKRQRTYVQVRGKPAGQYLAWQVNHRDRNPINVTDEDEWLRLLNFRRIVDTDANTVTFAWDWGQLVEQCWINQATVAQPETSDTFDSFDPDDPDFVVDRDTTTAQHVVTGPSEGNAIMLQFIPRSETLVAGPVVRAVVHPLSSFSIDDIDAGSITADKLTDQARSFTTDISFSATDYNTVAWTSGSLELANGDTFSITGSNTGDISAITYIYFDRTASTTALQTTTDYTVAIGDDVILMCVAKDSSVSTSKAFYVPGVGVLGLTRDQLAPDTIGQTEIADNSITTGKIAANTIQAGDIAAGAVDTSELAAGAVTTDELEANAVTAAKINVVSLSSIQADVGTLTAGVINGGNGVIIDLDATDSQDVIFATNFKIRADGTAIFAGALSAATGSFSGSLNANSIELRTAGGTLRGDIYTGVSGTLQIRDAGGTDHILITVSGGMQFDEGFSSSGTTTAIRPSGKLTLGAAGSTLAFFNVGGTTKQTITGSRDNNAALADLLIALKDYGLIVNNTTAT